MGTKYIEEEIQVLALVTISYKVDGDKSTRDEALNSAIECVKSCYISSSIEGSRTTKAKVINIGNFVGDAFDKGVNSFKLWRENPYKAVYVAQDRYNFVRHNLKELYAKED